jgi:prepilin-type N-terminal cleavage/methylation domain-containing protein
MSNLHEEGGFTLIELLVTMALAAIIFGATLTVLEVFQRQNSVDVERNEVQDQARNTVDQIERQLRNVSAPTAGSPGALLVIEPWETIFDTVDSSSSYSWGANVGHTMMVRYCLRKKVVWMQVKRWSTAEGPKEPPKPPECPDRSGYWETTRQVTTHVTNKSEVGPPGNSPPHLFKYSAATAPQTASVEVDMFVNLNPTHPHPGATELTTGVALRNANRPPVAVFSITRVNKFIRLDASASHDPEGLAVTYKWAIDGTALSSTSQIVEQEESVASHTYELEVTDPGGLSEKKVETVNL